MYCCMSNKDSKDSIFSYNLQDSIWVPNGDRSRFGLVASSVRPSVRAKPSWVFFLAWILDRWFDLRPFLYDFVSFVSCHYYTQQSIIGFRTTGSNHYLQSMRESVIMRPQRDSYQHYMAFLFFFWYLSSLLLLLTTTTTTSDAFSLTNYNIIGRGGSGRTIITTTVTTTADSRPRSLAYDTNSRLWLTSEGGDENAATDEDEEEEENVPAAAAVAPPSSSNGSSSSRRSSSSTSPPPKALDPLVRSLTRMDEETKNAPTMNVPLWGELIVDKSLMVLLPAGAFAVLGLLLSINVALNSQDKFFDPNPVPPPPVNNKVVKSDDGCRGLCSQDTANLENFLNSLRK